MINELSLEKKKDSVEIENNKKKVINVLEMATQAFEQALKKDPKHLSSL